MGKKDDWFSKKGIKNHKKGMEKKEWIGRKICFSILFGCSFIITISFGAIFAAMSSRAMALESVDLFDRVDIPIYDTCKYPTYKVSELNIIAAATAERALVEYCYQQPDQCRSGTQWSGVYTFNAAVLIVTAVNFVVLTCGAFLFYPRYFGTLCNMCYSCCNCCAAFSAIAVRFGPFGIWCSYNESPYTYDNEKLVLNGPTYMSDGSILGAIGLLNAIFWCFQCYCCCLPLFTTPVYSKRSSNQVESSSDAEARQRQQPSSNQQ